MIRSNVKKLEGMSLKPSKASQFIVYIQFSLIRATINKIEIASLYDKERNVYVIIFHCIILKEICSNYVGLLN